MLKPQLHQYQSNSTTTRAHFLLSKPFINGGSEHATLLVKLLPVNQFNKARRCIVRAASSKPRATPSSINIEAIDDSTVREHQFFKVKAIATVKQTIGGMLTSLGIERGLDDIQDLLGKTLLLELVSTELDLSEYRFQ
ncbi:conserved hypothetical protein [Ricinus communis]|uniref:Uncharacterized protein n=1 Tax=Ricinus communis TaxID=3988 RepID=B9RI73_RICCO|nr:conserved hypothetical protein [Ricinus communis]